MRRATVLWTVLAVSGVLLVAGVTVAASTLSTQTIGLSSEPLSAGDRLAPKATRTPQAAAAPQQKKQPKPKATATAAPPTATATAAPPVAPATPVITDDHGGDDNSGSDDSGRGRGRGRGRGGDDD